MPPDPMQALPIFEIRTFPNVAIDVARDPSGNLALTVDVLGKGERLVFPMGAEYAEKLGQKLTAPRVVVAPAGAVNGNGRH